MAAPAKKGLDIQVYVGTVRGAIGYTECNKSKKANYNLNELDTEITALEWGRTQNEILLGNKSGAVKLFDCLESKFTKTIENIEGKGPVIGLACIDQTIIIGRKDGIINKYKDSKSGGENDTFKININEDATVECLVLDNRNNQVATGGEKNDLKIWDITQNTAVFKAKSMGHDELELPIPTTVRAICFFGEGNLVGCASKEGSILLYDPRAQRRPIKKYSEAKASFTALATYRERQCLVGTTKGYMQLVDMRTGKCLKTFKPCAGSVTGITCDPFEPIVASTSLDRFLRVHNVETKELVHNEYMKMSLTKIIMRPLIKEEKEIETEDGNEIVATANKVDDPIDEEYEGLFKSMETVNDNDDEEVPVVRRLPKLVNKRKVIKLKPAKKKRLSNK